MGASFAKSILKIRGPKARAASPETEWSLGWVNYARTDLPPTTETGRAKNPAAPAADVTSSPQTSALQDGANTEDRS
jgi:hypothetical protein